MSCTFLVSCIFYDYATVYLYSDDILYLIITTVE
jgi:hypothetical protein